MCCRGSGSTRSLRSSAGLGLGLNEMSRRASLTCSPFDANHPERVNNVNESKDSALTSRRLFCSQGPDDNLNLEKSGLVPCSS